MKDIKGYEGLYAVTSCGRVWSYRTNRFLKASYKSGYLFVILQKNGKQKNCFIHRLVAEAYIENPNNLPEVNHLDEIKTNNSINNLEWITHIDNINYGTRNERAGKARSKAVYCLELDRTYESITAASYDLGLQKSQICNCCKGLRKTTGGYHWRYAAI